MNMTITIKYFKSGTMELEEIVFQGEAHATYQASSDWRHAHLHTRIYDVITKLN